MAGRKEGVNHFSGTGEVSADGKEAERQYLEEQLSLARRRIYRFSNSLADHALVEELERRYALTGTISPFSREAIQTFIERMARGGQCSMSTDEIAIREGINVESEIQRRIEYEASHGETKAPAKAVFIVGSPRSGTSFLYNLLAYQGLFSYFTNISHFKWSLYNLNHADNKQHFQVVGDSFFSLDTKPTRLRTDLILPSECEDILDRSVHVYEQMRTHQYLLKEPEIMDPEILRTNVSKHMHHFGSPYFLCKSPFNTFRIAQLVELFGDSCYFLHLHRNGYCAAASIEANGFKYFTATDNRDDPALYWARHIEEVLKFRGEVKMLDVAYDSLAGDSSRTLREIFEWLEIDATPIEVAGHFREDRRAEVQYPRNDLIEKYNLLLGYGEPN